MTSEPAVRDDDDEIHHINQLVDIDYSCCPGASSLELHRMEKPEAAMMAWEDRIVIDPKILTGKPVIKGTRLAVEFIVDLLAQGWPEAEILRNYPGVTGEDIRACLAYASAVLHAEKVYPLTA